MKPIVHYCGNAIAFYGRAILCPIDHPNHLDEHEVTNTKEVITSPVISWVNGTIETQNTIYKPVSQ